VTYARAGAVITWLYAAGFGLSTIPVAIYLTRRGKLPTFFDLFEMYGGSWSGRVQHSTFVWLLLAFLVVLVTAAVAAWFVWSGSRLGAVVSLSLITIEAVFWIGFALPIPWVLGAARIVLLLGGWRSLR
jgi:hypothetical protein